MAQTFEVLSDAHIAFIERQHVFFVASAAPGARINLSPKDGASLRVLGPDAVVYRDLTGSGNETAAHLLADGRLTFMFCAFEGPPLILRLYGRGRVLHLSSIEGKALLRQAFADAAPSGTRQLVNLGIERVQTSCGFGVPRFTYSRDRDNLTRWADAKGPHGLARYRAQNNRHSIDGLPTGWSDPADEAPEAMLNAD